MPVSDRRQGKELSLWNRRLIIAAETVLFPPLTENHHISTHTRGQTDTHWFGKSLNGNLSKPPQKPKQSGIKANPACVQYVRVRACAEQMSALVSQR